MKRFILNGLLAGALLVGACSKVIIYEASDKEIAKYSNVYIPQAERGVISGGLSTSGAPSEFTYSAYLGGPVAARSDLSVTFGVDERQVAAYNEANGTNYDLLPAASYQLGAAQATIASGKYGTGGFKVTILPSEALDLFETYVLPISITSVTGDTKISDEFSTLYMLFTVGYPPGQVPREQVLSLGAGWGTILSNGVRGSLIRKDNVNNILVHEVDAEGHFTIPPRVIAVNWDASESFYYVNESAVVVRNFPYWAGLFSFRVDEHFGLPIADPHWLGDFWDKYKFIIPHKAFFFTVDHEGVMRRQPVLSDVNALRVDVGSGFQIFRQVVSYGDYLLALEPNGVLWLYPMSEEGVPGARRRVGEGWDIYTKIIVSGSDILALDAQGDVYRYAFDPRGFFPLR